MRDGGRARVRRSEKPRLSAGVAVRVCALASGTAHGDASLVVLANYGGLNECFSVSIWHIQLCRCILAIQLTKPSPTSIPLKPPLAISHSPTPQPPPTPPSPQPLISPSSLHYHPPTQPQPILDHRYNYHFVKPHHIKPHHITSHSSTAHSPAKQPSYTRHRTDIKFAECHTHYYQVPHSMYLYLY